MNINKTALWSLIFSVLCLLAAIATLLTERIFSSMVFFGAFMSLGIYGIAVQYITIKQEGT